MDLHIEYLPPQALKPYGNNTRKHGPQDIDGIVKSIEDAGFCDPIGIWGPDNLIVEGHGRQLAALQMGLDKVPCIRLDHLTDAQRREYAIRHNRTAEGSAWDFGKLEEEIARLQIEGVDLAGLDFDLGADDSGKWDAQPSQTLAERFLIPPFSVFHTTRGEWPKRKKEWRRLMGDKGEARGDARTFGFYDGYGGLGNIASVSLLDPVLCEVACTWFMPGTGKVFDVFAGDTSFGFVSSYLGNTFTGIELREEQCKFNRDACAGMPAEYICGDGRDVLQYIARESQDLFFSCPPYFDLEVYSDLEADASNQKTYGEFYAIIDKAFSDAVECLKPDRFAVIVCGDVRNRKTGEYYGFPDDIKGTFKRCGLSLYNEMVLVDPIASAKLRAAANMKSRKVTKVHQNILVFYKGDTRKIKDVFPEIEVAVDDGEDLEL